MILLFDDDTPLLTSVTSLTRERLLTVQISNRWENQRLFTRLESFVWSLLDEAGQGFLGRSPAGGCPLLLLQRVVCTQATKGNHFSRITAKGCEIFWVSFPLPFSVCWSDASLSRLLVLFLILRAGPSLLPWPHPLSFWSTPPAESSLLRRLSPLIRWRHSFPIFFFLQWAGSSTDVNDANSDGAHTPVTMRSVQADANAERTSVDAKTDRTSVMHWRSAQIRACKNGAHPRVCNCDAHTRACNCEAHTRGCSTCWSTFDYLPSPRPFLLWSEGPVAGHSLLLWRQDVSSVDPVHLHHCEPLAFDLVHLSCRAFSTSYSVSIDLVHLYRFARSCTDVLYHLRTCVWYWHSDTETHDVTSGQCITYFPEAPKRYEADDVDVRTRTSLSTTCVLFLQMTDMRVRTSLSTTFVLFLQRGDVGENRHERLV